MRGGEGGMVCKSGFVDVARIFSQNIGGKDKCVWGGGGQQ
jgi:hypothetical protein